MAASEVASPDMETDVFSLEGLPEPRDRSGLKVAGWYLFLSALSLIVLLPVYLVVLRAISTPVAAIGENPFVLHDPQWDVFRRAWDTGGLGDAMLRSLVVTVLITGGQLFTSILAAYAFAFLRFPLRNVVFALFMATLLLPIEVTLLANVHTVRDLGWFNSYQGLSVPFMAAAFGTFLIRQGFLGIPPEIRDATRLEGYGHWSFLWKFAVPLTRPVVASFTVISFLAAFNQYLWPRAVITNTQDWSTIQIALKSLTSDVDNINVSIAGAVLAALPIVILLILFSRQIVRGLTAGAVKG